MTRTLALAALLAITGCTGLDVAAIGGAVAERKAALNDFRARAWVRSGCDQALAGVKEMPEEMAVPLIEYCTGRRLMGVDRMLPRFEASE